MTDSEKLTMLKSLLNISDSTMDDKLGVYLSLSAQEIVNWMYINYAEVPDGAEMPAKYDTMQIYAVIAGLNAEGGENQDKHTENGIVREWHYTDMIEYIRAHVNQIPRVG